MFRIAALVAVVGTFTATQATGEENISAENDCPPHPLANARAIIKEAWDFEGWRQKNPVKRSQTEKLRRLRPCLSTEGRYPDPSARDKLLIYTQKAKIRFWKNRQYRLVAPFTGFRGEGYWLRYLAVPAWVVAAETRGYEGEGRWRAANPSGACGPYQLLGWTSCDTSSWRDKLRHHQVASTLPRGSWAVGY